MESGEPIIEEESPSVGHAYIIHKGDTLAKIVAACKALGMRITAAELLAANPGLDPARLKVGQNISVPGEVPEKAETESAE